MSARAVVASLLLVGCASASAPQPQPASHPPQAPSSTSAVAKSMSIEVLKPEGAGPFPAIVMLHDCSGLGPRSSGAPRRWARDLVARGYVVAIPDSFTGRGFASGVCVDPSPARADVAPFRRVPDAYDALDHLRTLAYVDGARVGVMGGSHGGATTLATIAMSARDPAPLAARKRQGFVAALALYPSCNIGNPRFTGEFKSAAALLILTGELDDWTPAAPCVKLVEAATRGGSSAAIKVYPGAHHSFDSSRPVRYVAERVNANAPGGRGATTGGNAEAWADSVREVHAFFARHLQPAR